MNEQFEMQFETSGYEIGHHLGVDSDRMSDCNPCLVDPKFRASLL